MNKERAELIASVILEDDSMMNMLVNGECEALHFVLNEHGFICTKKEIQSFYRWICELKDKYYLSNKELSEAILDEIIGGFGAYTGILIRKVLVGIS